MKDKSYSLESFLSPKNVVLVMLGLFYSLFLIFPVGIALVGSFHNWNPLRGSFEFTGFDHYIKLIKSPLFWQSLFNTLYFSSIVIAARLVLGLGIAYMLFSKMTKARGFFRAAIYMPVVTPLVAVSFVWLWLYNPQFGLFNQILGTRFNWLFNKNTALPAVMVMTIWKDYGYAVVLFLAGLYNLPTDCYEAARIDGASGPKIFWNITLPLLKPMTLFIFVTSLISYLQAYLQILIMTDGGPGTSTYLSSFLIFDEAFVKYKFGYASAISFVMFFLIACFTSVTFKITYFGGSRD